MINRLASKMVYQNDWMRVREDEVEFANGSRGIYSVVEKNDYALIVPFDGKKFYLVHQYRYPLQKHLWEFPQGMKEHDPHIDPQELAKQELKEETGFIAGKLEKVGYLYTTQSYCTQGYTIFLATDLQQGRQHLEVAELGMKVNAFSEEQLTDVFLKEGSDASTVSAYGLIKAKGLV